MRTAWLVLPLLLLGGLLLYVQRGPGAGAHEPGLGPDPERADGRGTTLVGVAPDAGRGSSPTGANPGPNQDRPLIDLRSRIIGLSFALEPGDLHGWEASVEWMALRLGVEAIPDLARMTFDDQLDLHAKIALANVLSALRSLQGQRIHGISSRMIGRISEQVGSGERTDNLAVDVAAARALAAWGHDGDRARMLQWAQRGQRQETQQPGRPGASLRHLLHALEEAPTFEVAEALARMADGSGLPHLREWVRLQGWTLGRLDIELLSTWMIEALVHVEADDARADAAHVLIGLGDAAIDRAIVLYLEQEAAEDARSPAIAPVLVARMEGSSLLDELARNEDSPLAHAVRTERARLEDLRNARSVSFGRRRLVSVFEIDLDDLRSRSDRSRRVNRLFAEPLDELQAELDSQIQDTSGSRAPFLLTVIPDLDAQRSLTMLGLHALGDQRPTVARHASRQLDRILGEAQAAEYLVQIQE